MQEREKYKRWSTPKVDRTGIKLQHKRMEKDSVRE
jgi:hypothetical protein